MKFTRLVAVALFAGACGGPLEPGLPSNPEVPDAPQVSTLGGRVFDVSSGLAIEGANVSVGTTMTLSAADGRYQLNGISSKAITLEASHAGYTPRSVLLPLAPGHNEFSLGMQKAPDL